jgi:hypothetical protein
LAGRAGASAAPARERRDRAGLGPSVCGVTSALGINVLEPFFPFALILLLVAMIHLP